jgi:phage gp16-like protein
MPDAARKTAPRTAPGSQTSTALRAHHAMARELALASDSRRALIERICPGKTSAGDLSLAELDRVNAELRRLGAGQKKGRRPRPAPDREAPVALARAIWISLHQLGAIEDPSDDALDAFARRQTKRATPTDEGLPLAWCTADEWPAIVEALWAIADRHGWIKPTRAEIKLHAEQRASVLGEDVTTPPEHLAKVRLIEAQWRRLVDLGRLRSGIHARLEHWCRYEGLGNVGWVGWLPIKSLERAAQLLGRWLNRALAEEAAKRESAS